MLYYYAHSGHKIGLERVRRGASLLKRLASEGYKSQLLVNDFRAGLVAKDLGVKDYITIDTIQDIDAIVEYGNSIIIDSPEDDHGRLVKFFADFKNVWRFEYTLEDKTIHGETLIRESCKEDNCISSFIIDDIYLENNLLNKEDRVLFFLGDSDHNKTILNNQDFFKLVDMELLLGNYFFVKYEDDLAKIFNTLHEPEEYRDLIKGSSKVVTTSSQTALEAKASGADVIFLEIMDNQLYSTKFLKLYGVKIVNGFDSEKLNNYLKENDFKESKRIEPFNIQDIKNRL